MEGNHMACYNKARAHWRPASLGQYLFFFIYIYKRWNIVQTRDLSASHRCVSTNSHKAMTLFNNYNFIIKPKISYQHFYKIDLSLDVVYVTIVVAGMMLKGYDKIMIK